MKAERGPKASRPILAAAVAFLVLSDVAAQEGPVWFWFAACGGPAMAIEVQLDKTTVYKSVFPVCRVDRASPASQGQQIGKIHFTFKPGRSIVWEGYRDTKDTTKAGHLLGGDIWQAGADPDDLLIGLSFADASRIHMNTVHIAHPSKRDESEVATGLTVVTYPVAEASGPGVRWPTPTGWKDETFALPPEFAPALPYRGTEELRFMPGFSSPTAPDFWSYDFVWWLDHPPAFDATSVAAALTTYFRGLATAVGGSKYQFDPERFRTVLTAVPDSEPPRLTGQVFTYDPFVTGLPITLNVEAALRSYPGTKQVAIVVALSPKETTDSVWNALRAAARALPSALDRE